MVFILMVSSLFFRKYFLPVLFLISIGYKNILATTGFNIPRQFKQEKGADTLRLLSWNVDDFINSERKADSSNTPRRIILSFIKSANADVMCFQDFMSFEENKSTFSDLKYLIDSLRYPYKYFSIDDTAKIKYFGYGTAIFSRYPITDSGRYAYLSKHSPEHLAYATINFKGKQIRIFNTHLRSMFLHWNGGEIHNNPFMQDDADMIFKGRTLQKLAYFDSIHLLQAELVKEQLNKCSSPFIFCADLNSVPSSYVYQHISSGLNDAFLQNGFGWGGTYSAISPSLRIDVVLMSKDLKSTQYYSPHIQNASDHYPIVTDIAIH